jgi:hypothetical protein
MNQEFVQILSLIFQGISAISVVFVFIQLFFNNRWNKINQTLNPRWRTQLDECFNEVKKLDKEFINLSSDKISDEELKKIKTNIEAERKIRNFLNHLEEISIAYNSGALHKEKAYCLFSNCIKKYFKYFKIFIDYVRVTDNDKDIYIGMQNLLRRWDKKYYEECIKISST